MQEKDRTITVFHVDAGELGGRLRRKLKGSGHMTPSPHSEICQVAETHTHTQNSTISCRGEKNSVCFHCRSASSTSLLL